MWWALPDLNRQPIGYEPTALTVELRARTCTRAARGGQALLAIELDAPPSPEALSFIASWQDVNWVRLLPKLMDG